MSDMPELPVSASGKTAVEVARLAAAEASRLIRAGHGLTSVSTVKGRGNVLTEVDLAVERAVQELLGREYPDHAVLSEETAAGVRSDGWMWVVDPVDGTKNFSRGLPHCCFTTALCFANEPVLGLTQQPLLDEEFLAVKGQGATLNGAPMRVSECGAVMDAVLAVDLGYNAERARRQLELVLGIWPGMQSLRVAGSAGLGFAYAAAGRWDAFVHSNLEPWDSAAGLLLVREAGGVVTDREGRPATIFSEAVVAGAPGVHADLMARAQGLPWE